jgi:HAE1 family hydrophobic/amphiphilic exporter-1
MFSKFIDRPVLFGNIYYYRNTGAIGLVSLPVSQYPEIAPPTVTATANYQELKPM